MHSLALWGKLLAAYATDGQSELGRLERSILTLARLRDTPVPGAEGHARLLLREHNIKAEGLKQCTLPVGPTPEREGEL